MMEFGAQQSFRKSFPFVKENLSSWFPGHMFKGMMKMQSKVKSVDCIIEVHDARIPFSGRNPNLRRKIIGTKPHILVLNKVDLIEPEYIPVIQKKILSNEPETKILFTNAKKQGRQFALNKMVPLALKMVEESNRFHRTFTPERCFMIIGVPNVGKSTLINALRYKGLLKGKAAIVGSKAGVTRAVSEKIKISSDPLTYLLDTPGILAPSINKAEAGMRLALCDCVQEHSIGETVMADYLLYWLNKNNNFHYVTHMGLSDPSDNITEVLIRTAIYLKKYVSLRTPNNELIYRPNILAAASHMLRGFREGLYGGIVLDEDSL